MLAHFFQGFRILHGILLALGAVSLFALWYRTRFWLPVYAHVLAVIGLIVGVFSVESATGDAPIAKYSLIGKCLAALALPAMVYFFFIFYGGQKSAYRRKAKSASEIADIVERFLDGKSLYPQEWNDFVECGHPDVRLNSYRRRCYELDPLVNSPAPRDPKAQAELRRIIEELRTQN